MTQVMFYFDFGSPNAFLSHRAIPAIEQRTGVAFKYVPVLLGGLFKLTGNQSPATAFAGIKNKPEYNRREMQRFIAQHGIADFNTKRPNGRPFQPFGRLVLRTGLAGGGAPRKDLYQAPLTHSSWVNIKGAWYKSNPFFPINTLQRMRGAIAAQEAGVFAAYVTQIYDDMWTRGIDMGQADIFAASMQAAGLPGDQILALSQTAPVKQRLLDNTQAAFEHGAFGSPSFLVGEELCFGKDRLRDVEDEIIRTKSAA